MSGRNVQTQFSLINTYEEIKDHGDPIFFSEDQFRQIISYYEEEGQLDEALSAVEDAIISFSFTIDFYTKKAALLIENHCTELALEVLDIAELLSPENFKVILLKAEALVRLRAFDAAQGLLETLKHLASPIQRAEILFVESLIFEFHNQYERVFFALKAVLEDDPRHAEALERIWGCIEINRSYEVGIKVFQDVLEKDPYSDQAWYYLGLAYAYLGRYDQAIEAFEFTMVANESFENGYRECAELYFELKKYNRALIVYLEMLEKFEAEADLLLRIGQCYQYLGQFELSEKYLIKSLKADHLNDEAYYYLGISCSNRGNWTQSVIYFEKAIEIEDRREEYFAALAESHFALDDLEKAEENFIKATQSIPEEAQFWVQYATFLIETGAPDRAIKVVDEAIEYVEESELQYCRIACLFALGKKQEAYYFLGEVLAFYYHDYPTLFDIMPALEHDQNVMALISNYAMSI